MRLYGGQPTATCSAARLKRRPVLPSLHSPNHFHRDGYGFLFSDLAFAAPEKSGACAGTERRIPSIRERKIGNREEEPVIPALMPCASPSLPIVHSKWREFHATLNQSAISIDDSSSQFTIIARSPPVTPLARTALAASRAPECRPAFAKSAANLLRSIWRKRRRWR